MMFMMKDPDLTCQCYIAEECAVAFPKEKYRATLVF